MYKVTFSEIVNEFSQQGTATDLVVQIVLIAESMRLQAMMATYGIQTQTPHEVYRFYTHMQHTNQKGFSDLKLG